MSAAKSHPVLVVNDANGSQWVPHRAYLDLREQLEALRDALEGIDYWVTGLAAADDVDTALTEIHRIARGALNPVASSEEDE